MIIINHYFLQILNIFVIWQQRRSSKTNHLQRSLHHLLRVSNLRQLVFFFKVNYHKPFPEFRTLPSIFSSFVKILTHPTNFQKLRSRGSEVTSPTAWTKIPSSNPAVGSVANWNTERMCNHEYNPNLNELIGVIWMIITGHIFKQ